MKNKDKKMLLFVIATIVTFFGIGYTLLKGTAATDTLSEVPANPAFDDINFYKCVVDAYNDENNASVEYDTNLTDEQLQTITSMSCGGYSISDDEKISSAKGLEKLTKLTNLNVQYNKLTELDVSKNTTLIKLYADHNQLIELDVSKNTALEYLYVSFNQLTNFDVTKNISLDYLYIDNNKLTKIDISQNTSLVHLYIGYNQLTELDVSKNKLLFTLNIDNNQLTNIDISNNTKLDYFSISSNQLTELDVSKNTALTFLTVGHNKLSKLDVSKNSKLYSLDISGSQITDINLSKNTELNLLFLAANKLKSLDVSKNKKLIWLYVGGNQLTSIDLSQNTALTTLNINDNQLTELDVTKNTKLYYLYTVNNQLTNLNLSKNTILNTLDIRNNKLTNLDVSKSTSLQYIYTSNNLFSDTYNLYKNDTCVVNEKITLPSQLIDETSVWTTSSNIISVDETNGLVIAKEIGTGKIVRTHSNYNLSYSHTVNVVEITSDKYKIDEDNSYIFVGTDIDIEDIKNNISKSHDNVNVDIDLDNNKLYVKYDEEVLKEFNIIGISFNDFDVLNNSINIAGEVTYDEFVSAINVSDGISYKLYTGEEVVTSGNVLKDMVLKIYYNDENIYEYVITDEYVNFDETLNVDKDNMVIEDILVDTMSDTVKGMIDTSGSIDVLDKDGNVLDTSRNLRTGDKFRVNLPNQTLIYSISVMGDVNGDGVINRDDVMLSSKHIIHGNLINGAEYLKATDMDNNNITNINDIIKMVKKIKN